MKLTKARIEVLRDLASNERLYYVDTYAPIKFLYQAGLVDVVKGRFSDSYCINNAGRSALRSALAQQERGK